MKYIALLLTTILLVCIYGCKGPQGDIGPSGRQGATGATGPQGTSGIAGASTIVTSAWSTTITNANWVRDQTDQSYYAITLSPTGLTANIIDRGIVMVYRRDPSFPAFVLALPYDYTNKVEGFFTYTEGTKNQLIIYQDYVGRALSPIPDVQYRWVFIPPQPGGRLASIDWKNYAEVKKALNLTD